jgi:hypothetical protein
MPTTCSPRICSGVGPVARPGCSGPSLCLAAVGTVMRAGDESRHGGQRVDAYGQFTLPSRVDDQIARSDTRQWRFRPPVRRSRRCHGPSVGCWPDSLRTRRRLSESSQLHSPPGGLRRPDGWSVADPLSTVRWRPMPGPLAAQARSRRVAPDVLLIRRLSVRPRLARQRAEGG